MSTAHCTEDACPLVVVCSLVLIVSRGWPKKTPHAPAMEPETNSLPKKGSPLPLPSVASLAITPEYPSHYEAGLGNLFLISLGFRPDRTVPQGGVPSGPQYLTRASVSLCPPPTTPPSP